MDSTVDTGLIICLLAKSTFANFIVHIIALIVLYRKYRHEADRVYRAAAQFLWIPVP